MKVRESPPIYCFLLLYCLNLIAQFDKLLPRNSEKFRSTPEDQTERKNDRFETPRLRDPSKTLLRFRDRAKIFWNPRQFFEVPFYNPTFKIDAAQLRFNLLQKNHRSFMWTSRYLKWFSCRRIKEQYGKVYRHTATRQEQIAKPWPVRPPG